MTEKTNHLLITLDSPELQYHILDLYHLGKSKYELSRKYEIPLSILEDWIYQSNLSFDHQAYHWQVPMQALSHLYLENKQLKKENERLKQTLCTDS